LSSDRAIELLSNAAFGFWLIVLHSIVDTSIFLLLLYLFNLQADRRVVRWTWTAIAINAGSGLAAGIVQLTWPDPGLEVL
jgi:hypothetical protein